MATRVVIVWSGTYSWQTDRHDHKAALHTHSGRLKIVCSISSTHRSYGVAVVHSTLLTCFLFIDSISPVASSINRACCPVLCVTIKINVHVFLSWEKQWWHLSTSVARETRLIGTGPQTDPKQPTSWSTPGQYLVYYRLSSPGCPQHWRSYTKMIPDSRVFVSYSHHS
jgi:hypothetical protein